MSTPKRGAKPLTLKGFAIISPSGTPRKWSWMVTIELQKAPRNWENVLDGYGSTVLVTFDGLGTKTARLDAWGSNEIDLEIKSKDLTEGVLRANKYNNTKPSYRPITIAPV
jgi:hypothetical protein